MIGSLSTLSRAFSDRRIAASLGAGFIAATILIGLGMASAVVGDDAAAVDALQARLEQLQRRPLPTPAKKVDRQGPMAGDVKLISAGSAGAAASQLQHILSDYAEEAGLTVRRMTVEPFAGDDAAHSVVLRLEADGGINALQATLFRIEAGLPYLFVDELELLLPVGADRNQLSIIATVRAQWKEVRP